ncbi:MAG: nuclear transport factor 2 family protein [Runella sp.]
MNNQPLYKETEALFRYVSEHNFNDLANLCDDDFGIVDLGTEGQSVMVRNRAEWENWFRTLFQNLSQMQAKTYTDILDYKVLQTSELAYSVVEFCQHLEVGDKHGKFFCVTTIIWKKMPDDTWKESRWHASLLRVEW